MVKIPDRTLDHYDRVLVNFVRASQKVRRLDNNYIDSTDNKILIKEIRDIFVDIMRVLKTVNGIQKDDDTDI